MLAHLKPLVIDLEIRQDDRAEDMKEKCPCCTTGIDPEEIYTDWFYCWVCEKDFPYHRERLNPEGGNNFKYPKDGILSPDWIVNLVSTCDSPTSENK